MRIGILLTIAVLFYSCSTSTTSEVASWEKQAEGITIIRDNWGIPHIYGKTDADAVFGLLYAQCEDDFNRVEVNYINAMGRMAEVEGAKSLYADLRMHLFIDTTEAKLIYNQSPEWLKKLCVAFADGANYYLHKHPEVKPKLITRFEPWMPFMFSEGSIGGDIETVSLNDLEEFYGDGSPIAAMDPLAEYEKEPTGSNGFAIAPSKSASGNALFLINPHTSFYFRSEVHMVSEEGLDAYGAVTWGQFFIYQGFNEHCGWMHTSSRADAIDEYAEAIVAKGDSMFYKYGEELRFMAPEPITLSYKDGAEMKRETFETYRTHHGPVIATREGKWISISLMNEPLKALTQSYMRTKANGYEAFNETMKLNTNSSNNTVYADDEGNIAYYHGNFIPIRDPKFDWLNPVDGSNPETDWKGLHSVDEQVKILNPETGWIQNCNATPFTVSGEASPKAEDYPFYMAPDEENFRGIHAVRVLKDSSSFTLSSLRDAAYDPYLPGFEKLIPSLIKSYEKSASADSKLSEPYKVMKDWDLRYAESSIATSLAMYYGIELRKAAIDNMPPRYDPIAMVDHMINSTSDKQKLEAFQRAIDTLENDFGTWKTPWGEINRFQRLTSNIVETFDDTKPSIPVGFASSLWGSLASYGARSYPNTKKWYGTGGNSFVALVEFGKPLKAKSILSGGQSSDPNSPHFDDQAEMYSKGEFKDVLFYREDVEKNAERTYRPGEK
ncbi:MAG: acylase [Cyclobacteriaceae bacterium]